jgi:hypothetical protein
MEKLFLIGAMGLVLASCAPQVPDSGRGVGFGDYNQYEADRARREAALTGNVSSAGASPMGAAVANATPVFPGPSSSSGAISPSDLAAAGIGAAPISSGPIGGPLPSNGLDIGRTQGVQASPSNVDPMLRRSTGLSDEQNFDAVAGRESIESDAERLARQAAAYQVVQPTALPSRSGTTGPNIIEYALNAPNAKGQAYYSRFRFSGEGRYVRNCASYRSADEAQRDFLARGGPERDPRGIDPDGDGFACSWDPAPFRQAVRSN